MALDKAVELGDAGDDVVFDARSVSSGRRAAATEEAAAMESTTTTSGLPLENVDDGAHALRSLAFAHPAVDPTVPAADFLPTDLRNLPALRSAQDEPQAAPDNAGMLTRAQPRGGRRTAASLNTARDPEPAVAPAEVCGPGESVALMRHKAEAGASVAAAAGRDWGPAS